MDTATISTPEYFENTFGVDAAQAAELSRQAGFVGANRGGGITAEAPAAVTAAPATPSPATLSARAEYDQLMADRAANKVSTEVYRKRERELAEIIANGAGEAPAPAASAPPTDPFAAHFAPPASSSDYKFPYTENTPTDESIEADRTLKDAMFEAKLPRSAVESILTNVAAAARAIAANPASLPERLAATKVRATAMWQKEGISWETALNTIEREVETWPEALQAQFVKNMRLLGPMDLDSILQISMYRNRAALGRQP
ncbi:MAG TPA: hypothetical protein VK251_03720 [Steroidobacteraceae bacterium]|nr:hypothetical protein [Steroidobacteraceae bacterium]